jgi:RNA polymerase sigma-32 factor
MQGVKKFEPDRGFRLATYAMWWIKASMQEFILRSWSLVKMGTTAAQKKLFFNLRRMKKQLEAYEDTDLKPEDVTKIATDLGVPEQEVINMNRRMMMGGDGSLNTPMRNGEDGSGEWQDWLTDDRPLQDETVADAEEAQVRHEMLIEAMDSLNEREQHILTERRLTENRRHWKSCRRFTTSAANASARSRCARLKSCRRRCSGSRGSGCCRGLLRFATGIKC